MRSRPMPRQPTNSSCSPAGAQNATSAQAKRPRRNDEAPSSRDHHPRRSCRRRCTNVPTARQAVMMTIVSMSAAVALSGRAVERSERSRCGKSLSNQINSSVRQVRGAKDGIAPRRVRRAVGAAGSQAPIRTPQRAKAASLQAPKAKSPGTPTPWALGRRQFRSCRQYGQHAGVSPIRGNETLWNIARRRGITPTSRWRI